MELTSPWMLLSLVALGVVALLHVMRLPGRRREVSDLRLWRRVLSHINPEAAQRRRRIDPILLVELATAALLAVALAGPVVLLQRPRRHVGILLDTSAGMNTVEPDGRTRIRSAADRMKPVLDTLSPDDRVSVVCLPRGGSLIDASPAEAATFLSRDASDAPIEPAKLLEAGLAALGNSANPVFLVTDHPPAGLVDPRLRLVTVGGASRNGGIVALAVTPKAGDNYDAFFRVANYSGATMTRTIHVGHPGAAESELSVDIPAGGAVERSVGVKVDAAHPVVEVRLNDTRDGLALDDAAWAVLRPLWVLATGSRLDPAYARLFGGPVFEGTLYAPVSALPASIPPQTLLIAQGTIPSRLAATTALVDPPAGRIAHIVIGNGVRLDKPASPTAASDDPLLRQVDLGELKLSRFRPLTLPPEAVPLMRIDDHVVAARLELAGQRVIVLSFSPSASGWTLKTSFVVFWANVLASIRRHRGDLEFTRTDATDLPVGLHQNAHLLAVDLLSPLESNNDVARTVDQTNLPLPAPIGAKQYALGGWFALLAAALVGVWWVARK